MRTHPFYMGLALMAGCAQLGAGVADHTGKSDLAQRAMPDSPHPIVRPDIAQNAPSPEGSSLAQQGAARAPTPAEGALGRTIATLGDPSRPGLWLETPLVRSATKGQVALPGSPVSITVELLPIPGPSGAGSRLSLAAMRLLGVALTDLPEIVVYGG